MIAIADPERLRRYRCHQLLLLIVLATVSMLFAGFAAAYLIRRTGTDWVTVSLPSLMWVTTGALLASSATLELARRARGGPWIALTSLLGLGFLGGQLFALAVWSQGGVAISAGPHAAFVYTLACVHAVHVGGGVTAIVATRRNPAVLGLAATYWHFMGGVWLALLVLLTWL